MFPADRKVQEAEYRQRSKELPHDEQVDSFPSVSQSTPHEDTMSTSQFNQTVGRIPRTCRYQPSPLFKEKNTPLFEYSNHSHSNSTFHFLTDLSGRMLILQVNPSIESLEPLQPIVNPSSPITTQFQSGTHDIVGLSMFTHVCMYCA